MVGYEIGLGKGHCVSLILEIDDISFLLIVVPEVSELLYFYDESWFGEELSDFVFGVVLSQMGFLLFGHFVVGVVVRVNQVQAIDHIWLGRSCLCLQYRLSFLEERVDGVGKLSTLQQIRIVVN